jgi:peptidoglycan-associated lipoprotein
MSTRCHLSYFRFCLCLLVVAMLSSCANRKIVTAVEDQSYVPGPTPQAQAPVAEAKVSPPIPPPVVEEARVVEQPVAPAPLSQQPVPQARPIPNLSDIFFDFDRFVIRDDARSGLEVDAGLLKSQSGEKIVIEGHCDERGTSAYNLVLGERRAQAAAQYLRDLSVPSSQMQVTSYGKERPFCAEHSEACWQSNRRAHFTR